MTEEFKARLYDQEITELPEDLYIPPEAFAVWIEQFEGPLDFLLYLVRKNGLDLTEMAILPITEQYLEYIGHLDSHHFELAGDYLLMAATLIDIKTRLMLPKPKAIEDEEDPTKNLLERLQIYAQIKEATVRIDKLIRLERDVHLAIVSLPDDSEPVVAEDSYDVALLQKAMMGIALRPRIIQHEIDADVVPLSERITDVSLKLQKFQFCRFLELIEPSQGRVGVVVSFVAVLELLKQRLIQITSRDDEPLTLNWVG